MDVLWIWPSHTQAFQDQPHGKLWRPEFSLLGFLGFRYKWEKGLVRAAMLVKITGSTEGTGRKQLSSLSLQSAAALLSPWEGFLEKVVAHREEAMYWWDPWTNKLLTLQKWTLQLISCGTFEDCRAEWMMWIIPLSDSQAQEVNAGVTSKPPLALFPGLHHCLVRRANALGWGGVQHTVGFIRYGFQVC